VILVDTSVWVDHLRAGDLALARWLDERMVLTHPFVIGEIALGNLRQREVVLSAMHDLPQAVTATDVEILRLIDRFDLSGRGIGYVDVSLLAAARLTPDAALYTRDRRLAELAALLGVAHGPQP
jgi:hypothetical protein